MKRVFVIFLIATLSCCYSDYRLCETTAPIPIGSETMEQVYDTIPKGKLILTSYSHFSNCYRVKYGDLEGYTMGAYWIVKKKVKSVDLDSLIFDIAALTYVFKEYTSQIDVYSENLKAILDIGSHDVSEVLSTSDMTTTKPTSNVLSTPSTRVTTPSTTDTIQTKSQPAEKVSTPSTKTSTGGTVQVKGYYRRDGTYVKPHTRKAPTKRK